MGCGESCGHWMREARGKRARGLRRVTTGHTRFRSCDSFQLQETLGTSLADTAVGWVFLFRSYLGRCHSCADRSIVIWWYCGPEGRWICGAIPRRDREATTSGGQAGGQLPRTRKCVRARACACVHVLMCLRVRALSTDAYEDAEQHATISDTKRSPYLCALRISWSVK